MYRRVVGRSTLFLSAFLFTITSFAIAGTPASVSVSPNQGSGTSQNFTFVFSDTGGWASLKQVNLNIAASGANTNACLVSYMPSNHFIYLLNDAGNAYLPGAPVGSSATLGNSQCSLNVQQAGAVGSGNTLTVYVTITFTAAYFGSELIYMEAVDNSAAISGWSTLGSWTVGGTTGGGNSTCTPGPAPSVTICSPTNGSTVGSPVHLVAVPASNKGVAAMAVYFDNNLVYKANVQKVDTQINATNGAHYVVVQFWDNSGNVPAKASENITVSGISSQPTATMSANPATINAVASSTLTWSTTNATSASIDNGVGTVPTGGSVTVSPSQTTTYTLTATGSNGTATATATVTVSSSGGGTCTPTGAAPSVTICSPTNGSTVSSPVHVVAAPASYNGVVAMAVYFDSTLVYKANVNKVDTKVNAAAGAHNVVVQFWDNSGNVPAKASENITVGSGGGTASVDVTTMHNDQARTGANTLETILTPANVTPAHFGKIVGYGVDGQVYAQPLYLSNLSIGGGHNNVVYVATEHDSVYAFDADNKRGTPYWSVSLIPPGQSPAASSDVEGISPEIGITGTPVISRANNAIYVVAMTHVSGVGNEFWLHALDLVTGAEKFGGPKRINPTVNGTGFGNVNGVVPLEGGCYQRAGLALASGNIYVSFGHCSHGWVVAYNETTLAQTAVFNSSANGKGAAIWMGGGAPALDSSNNLYFETGVDADSTTSSGYSDSFIKLSPGLGVLDYFMVSNNAYLTTNDADLGSGAPVVLPDNISAFPHQVVGAGKDGRIFLVNRDNMGQFNAGGDRIVQAVQSGVQQFDNFFDQPAYWNGNLYYHAENDVLRQFKWTNGLLSTSPVFTGTVTYGVHGATPSVSANGTSNGIVWELQVDGQPSGPAVLHAYDAANVSHELYNSNMNASDKAGPAVKFTVPTIVNGKVYVPAGHEVDIYGLVR